MRQIKSAQQLDNRIVFGVQDTAPPPRVKQSDKCSQCKLRKHASCTGGMRKAGQYAQCKCVCRKPLDLDPNL